MRYYKQFHNWPYVHLVALLFGCVCLSVAFVWGDFSAKVSMLAKSYKSLKKPVQPIPFILESIRIGLKYYNSDMNRQLTTYGSLSLV
jgi:hypothetical protein